MTSHLHDHFTIKIAMMIFAKALCPGYVLDIVWMERKRREAVSENSKKKA